MLTYKQAREAVDIFEANYDFAPLQQGVPGNNAGLIWAEALEQVIIPEWREQAKSEALKTRDDIKWIAMDYDGGWYGFTVSPTININLGTWSNGLNGRALDLRCLNMPDVPQEDWEKTLIEIRD